MKFLSMCSCTPRQHAIQLFIYVYVQPFKLFTAYVYVQSIALSEYLCI